MRYTEHKQEVEVPEWINGHDVGDRISFLNPVTDEVIEKEIIGFSTIHKNHGLPVVGPIEGVEAKEIAVPEKYVVNDSKQVSV